MGPGAEDARDAAAINATHGELREAGSYTGIAAGVVLLAAGVLAFAGWQVALRLPQYFEIDYGEGFVWSQTADLLAGQLYQPLSRYPLALMHYTPLFHAAAALLWRLGLDPLFAGRLISLGAGTALACACGVLSYLGVPPTRAPRLRWLAAATGFALAAGTPEIIEWSTLMRVDMLSTRLGTLGLAALAAGGRRSAGIAVAGLCFLLAISAKQSAIAPMVAGIGALLYTRPRAGLWLMVALTFAIAIGVAFAELATAGEFLRHTVLYDAARVRWDKFFVQAALLLPKSVNVIGIATLFAILRRRQRKSPQKATETSDFVCLALSLDLALGFLGCLGLAKLGAGSAYMLPLLVPAAALAAIAIAQWSRRAVILLIILAGQIAFGLATYPFASRAALAAQDQADRQMLQRIDAVDGPVLSEDMSLLMRAGRPVPWELGSITELTRLGIFDERPLVRLVRDRWFKLVIVETWAPQFYTPGIRGAIEANYRRVAEVPPFEVWEPRPLAPPAAPDRARP